MAAQKSLSPQKAQTFPPWGGRATTFEESTARKLTVVNQSKNCQQRKTRGREKNSGNEGNSIWRNTNVFFLLPDIADMPAPDL